MQPGMLYNRAQAVKDFFLTKKGMALFFVVFGFFIFFGMLKNGIVDFDDNVLIEGNTMVTNGDVKRMFQWAPNHTFKDYIPVTFMSYALEYKLFKSKIMYYQLNNMLLHLANTVLVMLLLFKLTSNRAVTFLSSMLFLIHPLHVESVAWLAQRKDVLSGLFMLLALLLYTKYVDRLQDRKQKGVVIAGFLLGVMALFTISILSKLMAVTLPALLLLWDYKAQRKITWKVLLEKVPFGLISLGVFYVNYQVRLTYFDIKNNPVSVLASVIYALKAPLFYLSKSIAPLNQSPFYQVGSVDLTILDYVLGLSVLGLIAYSLKKSWRTRKDLVYCALFFAITIFPVLKFIPFGTEFIFADRFMYVPSIGLFTLFAFGVNWAVKELDLNYPRIQGALLGSVAVVCLVYAALTVEQIKIWQSPETLWPKTISQYPTNTKAINKLGDYYVKINRLAYASDLYRRATEIDPKDGLAYYNLGTVYMNLNQCKEAVQEYDKAARANPYMIEPYNNTGICLLKSGQNAEAKKMFEIAVQMDSRSPLYRNNLAYTTYLLGDLKEAKKLFEEVLAMDPHYPSALDNRDNIAKLIAEGKNKETKSKDKTEKVSKL